MASVLALMLFALVAPALTIPFSASTAADQVPRVSVNLFDAWYNRLPGGQGRAVSQQHMTDACSSNGFNVIRVATAPFWPIDAKLLTDDEQQASCSRCMFPC
jgi:hypothetical protein